MSSGHDHLVLDPETVLAEPRFLESSGRRAAIVSGAIGIALLLAALFIGISAHDGFKHFSFSYLTGFMYFLSISLGALFFTAIQFVVRASWSVVVRRIAEATAALFPVLAILALPIILPVVFGNSPLYAWDGAAGAGASPLLAAKQPFLNQWFFLARMIVYFGVWGFCAGYFFRNSVRQDESKDYKVTLKFERLSPLVLVTLALTLTFAAIDFGMSLDYTWFSTIFGVYFFSGCVVGFMAFLTLGAMAFQFSGRLRRVITVEHYHDMGKLIFAFLFFWAYIAFSQYMLIWYANLPEETGWFHRRQEGEWLWFAVALLLVHFVIPFLYMISRGIKRRKRLLLAGALWMLAAHYVDMYYIVMPEFSPGKVPFGMLDVLVLFGLGGLFVSALLFLLGKCSLVPVGDPRLRDSLRFENV